MTNKRQSAEYREVISLEIKGEAWLLLEIPLPTVDLVGQVESIKVQNGNS